MPNIISEWLRTREEKKQVENGPPTLPARRPRSLSIGHLESGTNGYNDQSRSIFFQRLPAELRHRILVQAFGGQTIHFDLRLLHPVKNYGPCRRLGYCHTHSDTDRPRDENKARRWEWWSSVCHRSAPPIHWNDHMPIDMRLQWRQPWQDQCRRGEARYCYAWPPRTDQEELEGIRCYGSKSQYPPGLLHKCHVGALGWLRACRQAYVEGIHVLYSTNRFFIESTYLARQLRHLLLPSRLAQIREVELVWRLEPSKNGNISTASARGNPDIITRSGHPREDSDLGPEEYRALVSSLPDVLPNLRYLHIDISGYLSNLRNTSPPAPLALAVLLGAIDAAVSTWCCNDQGNKGSTTPSLECRVSLHEDWYRYYNYYDELTGGQTEDKELYQIWRSLEIRPAGQVPEPGGNEKERPGRGMGYWISRGLVVPPVPYSFWA